MLVATRHAAPAITLQLFFQELMAQKMVPIGLNFFFVFLRNHLSLKKRLRMLKTHAQRTQGCQRNDPPLLLEVTENDTLEAHCKDGILVL